MGFLKKLFGSSEQDLVEADYFNGCCEECAKYRGRWFSISGKDKRFPKKPPENYGCTCQGLTFMPVIYGVSEPTYCPKKTNIIEYSNRPFVDDRTKKEKENHQHYLDTIAFEKIKNNDKAEYDKLVSALPNDTPKTFSAYRRMKISETAKFNELAKKAASLGLNIRLSKENKNLIDRYNKYEKAQK